MSEIAAPAKSTGGSCPICGEAAAREHFPFCSRRCADVDLNRWLKGVYVIPATEEAAENSIPDEE